MSRESECKSREIQKETWRDREEEIRAGAQSQREWRLDSSQSPDFRPQESWLHCWVPERPLEPHNNPFDLSSGEWTSAASPQILTSTACHQSCFTPPDYMPPTPSFPIRATPAVCPKDSREAKDSRGRVSCLMWLWLTFRGHHP